jgi:hypothetical protein
LDSSREVGGMGVVGDGRSKREAKCERDRRAIGAGKVLDSDGMEGGLGGATKGLMQERGRTPRRPLTGDALAIRCRPGGKTSIKKWSLGVYHWTSFGGLGQKQNSALAM